MTARLLILAVFCVHLTVGWSAFAGTYHVAIAGNDAQPGTRDRPVRTINRAAQMARAGDTVLVGPGRYHEYIVVPNSGAAGKPITFRASGEGEAVVSAAHPLSGFAKTPGLRNVYETDLRAIFPATGELECYGLIDDTSLRAYVLLPSREACDVAAASFALDSERGAFSAHR